MRSGSAFGGPAFWSALKDTGVEREVRALYLDAKKTLQRMGGLSMQVHPWQWLYMKGAGKMSCCERLWGRVAVAEDCTKSAGWA